ncbi:DUF2730 family protein [Psychrobacter sp. HD31]|uniref:DUF2730 family protein n=1 Tax=Psychrobacter sp. HD31 TaxID=3112003 RepID=UPI003DA23495
MQEIIDYITSHWAIFMTVVGVIGSIAYLKLDARYARKSEIKEIVAKQDKKNNEIDGKIDELDKTMQHLPNAEDVIALRIAVEKMNGEISTLHAAVKPITRLTNLLIEKEVTTNKKGD